jgi:transposase InsO family protein
MARWLNTSDLASLAGLSDRQARRILARATSGCRWKGIKLDVRTISGRGGRRGLAFEVNLESLPPELQGAFRGTSLTIEAQLSRPAEYSPRVATEDEAARALKIFDKIKIATGALSPAARGAAVKQVHEQTGMPLRTVWRYVRSYNRHGLEGLMRRRPMNAGERRCAVSMTFDKAFVAAGHSPALLPDLAAYVDERVAGLWAGRGYTTGENRIQELAEDELYEHCQSQGVPLSKASCKIGRRRIREKRDHEIVAKRDHDAKAFANLLPSIVRSSTGCAPMEVVFSDVKHFDVMITRENGKPVYPKLIGFLDAGTQRIFSYFVMCPERHQVNQLLVAEALIEMCRDESWGLPKCLYLDNGTEFRGLDKIMPIISLINKEDGRGIIRAEPYNAKAKQIEGLFGRLDRTCFSSMPGYTGRDRTDKKTQNVGREPVPWQGSFEDFTEHCGMLIETYHRRKIGGQWRDRSPYEILQSKVDDGWRPIFAERFALELAFCDRKRARLYKDGVSYKGVKYTHPGFLDLPGQKFVDLLIPYRGGEAPIALLPTGWARLSENYPYHLLDRAGAVAAKKNRETYKRAVARKKAEAPPIDPAPILRRMADRSDAPIIPGRRRVLDTGESSNVLSFPAGQLIDQASAATSDDFDPAARRRAIEKRRTERIMKALQHGQ